MWAVYQGKRFVGIVETNFAFASKYWREQSIKYKLCYRLVPVDNIPAGANPRNY